MSISSFFALVTVVATLFVMSLLVERVFGRSRKEFRKPAGTVALLILFVPAGFMAYTYVPLNSPYFYAAYALAGGLAVLVVQCFFGVKLETPSKPGQTQ